MHFPQMSKCSISRNFMNGGRFKVRDPNIYSFRFKLPNAYLMK